MTSTVKNRNERTHAHLLVLSYSSPVTWFSIPRILNGSAHSGMGLSTSIKLLPTADLHLTNEDTSTFMSFLGDPMSLIGLLIEYG